MLVFSLVLFCNLHLVKVGPPVPDITTTSTAISACLQTRTSLFRLPRLLQRLRKQRLRYSGGLSSPSFDAGQPAPSAYRLGLGGWACDVIVTHATGSLQDQIR